MDRSFLSDEKLIKISRDFICIRTATYEDKNEAKFLENVFVDRSGTGLRNFGYCILSPDGKRKIRSSQRGPNFVYKDSKAMAADLTQIASTFNGRTINQKLPPAVPQMKDVRLGINVASCDGLPSVIVVGNLPSEVDQLNRKLAEVIWDEEIAGKFIYASTTNKRDLDIVSGSKPDRGILVIQPDVYGLKGRVIKAIAAEASSEDLKNSLSKAADSFKRISKNHGTHVRNGRRGGESWKTEVPVPERNRFRGNGNQGRRNQRK